MINKIQKPVIELIKEFKYLFSNPKPILFDHLPKCAGASISYYLSNVYPNRVTYAIRAKNMTELIELFKGLPEKKRYKFKLIYGHMASELLSYANPKSIKVVVLREPIDRIVSHYYYVKRNKTHYLYKYIKDNNIQLDDYCYIPLNHELENWYVTHFSKLSTAEVERYPQKALDLALNNILTNYDLIGFQENIPSLINEVSRVANINYKYENKIINKTKNRVRLNDISAKTIERITKKNLLDIEFYSTLIKLRDEQRFNTGCLLPKES